MEVFGNLVVYLIMLFAFIGAVCSIYNEDSEIGKQFLNGIYSIGPIFLPVAGVMAASPYITAFVGTVFGTVFLLFGADPAIAATTFIAVDMGGYQLADVLAQSRESWIMAMITGFMAGATIVFSIPVALKMLEKSDRKYFALGTMAGFFTIPVGVLAGTLICYFTNPFIRENINTAEVSNYQLQFEFTEIIFNLIPLTIICLIIAIGLFYVPQKMIKGFIVFGKIMDSLLRLVFVFCVIEYFTGFFTSIFGSWGFEPIIADEEDINRALEVSGYIGIMLCGVFPLVYVIKRYLSKPLIILGNKFGLSLDATAGLLAGAANVLALFALIKDMKPEDKVKTIAFSVTSAFLIGDHLAFTANFQPNMILPVMCGKLLAGLLAVYIANKFICKRLELFK